jgi:hypothetical protein
MKLKDLLNEFAATVTANTIKVQPNDRSLPAVTRFTPEQVANAIRYKITTSGHKIVEPLLIKSTGGNRYSITGQGTNLMATFDNNTGKVDLFNA